MIPDILHDIAVVIVDLHGIVYCLRDPVQSAPLFEPVALLKEVLTGGGYLFKQEPGRFKKRYVGNRVRASQVRRHLKKICAELNIPYRPPHKFRKTYASILKAADVDDTTIIDQIGHTDIKITENVYIKDRNRMKEKSRILGEIDELRLDPTRKGKPELQGHKLL